MQYAEIGVVNATGNTRTMVSFQDPGGTLSKHDSKKFEGISILRSNLRRSTIAVISHGYEREVKRKRK